MTFSWPDTTPPATTAVRAELQRVSVMIAIAGSLAASRRTIDLTGLEQAAGALCARVLDLAPAEGRAVRPALLELNDRVRQLTATISAATR